MDDLPHPSLDDEERLLTLAELQRLEDFTMLLDSPGADGLSEDSACELAVQIVRQYRSRKNLGNSPLDGLNNFRR